MSVVAVQDPVCGMRVNPENAKHSLSHGGTTYYFCCPSCAEKFKARPEKYLNKTALPAPGLVVLGAPKPTPAGAKTRDPVCGMDVDPSTAKFQFEYQGTPYYFCSAGCLARFRANPNSYFTAKSHPAGPSAPAGAYVCPMCPEVRETRPVPCPKCGMALEPEVPLPRSQVEYTCPMHP